MPSKTPGRAWSHSEDPNTDPTFPYANSKDLHYHISVGAVVRNDKGEVLVLCRPDGTCVLTTETMRPRETPLETLARGIIEELGATARVTRFLGATEMPFRWGGDGDHYEKTILWHEMLLESIDESLRAAGDDETGAEAVWLSVKQAEAVFTEQGRTLNDWDFSAVIERLENPS